MGHVRARVARMFPVLLVLLSLAAAWAHSLDPSFLRALTYTVGNSVLTDPGFVNPPGNNPFGSDTVAARLHLLVQDAITRLQQLPFAIPSQSINTDAVAGCYKVSLANAVPSYTLVGNQVHPMFMNGTAIQLSFGVATSITYALTTHNCSVAITGACSSQCVADCTNPRATITGLLSAVIVLDLSVAPDGAIVTVPRVPVLTYDHLTANLGCNGVADFLWNTGYPTALQNMVVANGVAGMRACVCVCVGDRVTWPGSGFTMVLPRCASRMQTQRFKVAPCARPSATR